MYTIPRIRWKSFLSNCFETHRVPLTTCPFPQNIHLLRQRAQRPTQLPRQKPRPQRLARALAVPARALCVGLCVALFVGAGGQLEVLVQVRLGDAIVVVEEFVGL